MLQRILLPVFCLIVGIVSGYWFGQTPSVPAPTIASADKTRVAPQPQSKAPPATQPLVPAMPPRTAPASLDELLDDFSAKRAKKFTDGMSVADIQASLAYMAGKPKDSSATSMRMALLRAWAKLDPQGAWAAALALPSATDRSSALGAIAGELAKTGPDAAIKLAMALDAPAQRKNVLRNLFTDWGKENPTAALAYWSQHPEIPLDSLTIGSVISAIAINDPAAAARLALTLPVNDMGALLSDSAIRSALDKWNESDPAAARRWLGTISDPTQRDRALSAFAGGRSMTDPQEAMDVVGQITSSDLRREAMKNIMRTWIGNDPASAIKYFAAFDQNTTDPSIGWAVGFAMRDLTELEQNQLLAQFPEGKLKTGIVTDIVRSYTSSGRYTQGVAALNQMPESTSRDQSLHTLAASWAQSEPKAVLAWINKQPDSSDRDLVVAGYSATLAATDPAAALTWAQGIPDASVQKAALRNVVSRWMKGDPAAAKAWLDDTPLLTKFDKEFINRAPGISIPLPPTVKQRR